VQHLKQSIYAQVTSLQPYSYHVLSQLYNAPYDDAFYASLFKVDLQVYMPIFLSPLVIPTHLSYTVSYRCHSIFHQIFSIYHHLLKVSTFYDQQDSHISEYFCRVYKQHTLYLSINQTLQIQTYYTCSNSIMNYDSLMSTQFYLSSISMLDHPLSSIINDAGYLSIAYPYQIYPHMNDIIYLHLIYTELMLNILSLLTLLFVIKNLIGIIL
jgi:hypothetical protein